MLGTISLRARAVLSQCQAQRFPGSVSKPHWAGARSVCRVHSQWALRAYLAVSPVCLYASGATWSDVATGIIALILMLAWLPYLGAWKDVAFGIIALTPMLASLLTPGRGADAA